MNTILDKTMTLSRLISRGAPLDKKQKGYYAIHVAAARGSRNSLEVLCTLSKEVAPHIDSPSDDEKSPLHVATINKQVCKYQSNH
jgi:hypothetical protein